MSAAALARQDGAAGGLEALAFGVLVFVLGTLLVVNAWGVVDGKLAATAAAREATRTVVEAPGGPDSLAAATTAARDTARATLRAHGGDPRRLHPLRLEAPTTDGALTRCARVAGIVRYDVPVVALPGLGWHTGTITVEAHHSELVDPFRSGLDTRAELDCG